MDGEPEISSVEPTSVEPAPDFITHSEHAIGTPETNAELLAEQVFQNQLADEEMRI